MRNKISLLLAVLAMISVYSVPVFAQGNSEVSANFTGNFQNTVTGLGVTDAPTDSGGLLVNYRYHFNRWSAIEANYSWTRFAQSYNTGTLSQANMNEASLAYQFTFGISEEKKLHPFVEVGTGALFFSAPITPGSTTAGLSQQRPALLYGGGVSYKLAHGLSAQVGYRGLVYKAADFSVPGQVTNAAAHMAQPYVGLSFRF
jgi:opacity protein-like surface antigen